MKNKLDKKLTLYGLTMIAVGSCIGSGIFASPGQIASAVPNHLLVLIVWGLGGLIALTGALTFSELGAMFPKAGGVYVFLKEAYGDLVGFLYGWVILLVITTGALAALAITFVDYMSFFYEFSETGKIILAICTIIGLTVVNMVGVNVSQIFSNLFTGLKLFALVVIILIGFMFYNAEKVPLDFSLASAPDNMMSAVLVALIGVLWAVGGWHHASYLGAETIKAERTVPKAMIFGVIIVTVTYIFANLAYMMLLPLDDIAASQRVAGDAIATIFPGGGKIVAVAIAISVFGTISIYTMTAPRIYYAMAEDGIFFKKLAYVHPRWKTPVNAMIVQAVWACVLLVMWETFHNLISYVVFMDILFMVMAGISIFIFRNKRPDAHRPVKALGYPIIPLIFIVISIAFVGSTFLEKPEQAWAGLGVLISGLPIYYFFKSKRES